MSNLVALTASHYTSISIAIVSQSTMLHELTQAVLRYPSIYHMRTVAVGKYHSEGYFVQMSLTSVHSQFLRVTLK